MSLADLSIAELDEIVENGFSYDYNETRWNSETKKIEQTGRIVYCETSGWHEFFEAAGYEIHDLGRLELIDSYGGEGKGDEYWQVFSLTEGDVTRTFKRDGWYASHDGGYYNGPTTEVKPVQKTITAWE